jgi:hypothetical protein
MLVYKAIELEQDLGRDHPWTESEKCSDWKYHDFKSHPELIPKVLEDFRPYAHFQASQLFYDVVGWMNGTESCLESNDCELQGPHPNIDKQFKKTLRTRGRLMVFFRKLELNCLLGKARWLEDCYEFYLRRVMPQFVWGVVGLTKFRTRFTELDKTGHILILSFWAYGDDEAETMENLRHTFSGLHQASLLVNNQIKKWGLCP